MKVIFTALLLSIFLHNSHPSGATVLTFDDITTTPQCTINSADPAYGGFTWDPNWNVINKSTGSGYEKGTVSGNYCAFNGAQPVEIAGKLFDFEGAYLTGAWADVNILVSGYLDTTLLYSKSIAVPGSGPSWFNFDYNGIDRLVFNPGQRNFVMDNFTFEDNSSVPEPGTIVLLGSGLAALASLRRRKHGTDQSLAAGK